MSELHVEGSATGPNAKRARHMQDEERSKDDQLQIMQRQLDAFTSPFVTELPGIRKLHEEAGKLFGHHDRQGGSTILCLL